MIGQIVEHRPCSMALETRPSLGPSSACDIVRLTNDNNYTFRPRGTWPARAFRWSPTSAQSTVTDGCPSTLWTFTPACGDTASCQARPKSYTYI